MKKIEITEQTTREELVAALSQYETTIADLEKKVEDASATVEAAEETIEDLKKQLTEATNKASALTETIKHKGKEYRIAAPKFNLNGEVRTAEDLKKDAKLVEELIEMGSGVLVPLIDREEKKKK